MVTHKFSIGLDFGTNSCRALLVDLTSGQELISEVDNYATGTAGILTDPKDDNVARQQPRDYHTSLEHVIIQLLNKADKIKGFKREFVIGIGVDATGSTPIPVNQLGIPLALKPEFNKNLNAMAWLWKDHSAVNEAEEITDLARRKFPEYINLYGGVYSSEWFWSKILHCLRTDQKLFNSACSWVELSDYIPALLTGNLNPVKLKRNVCAAGHKGMFNPDWGGLPSDKFLSLLARPLAELRSRLFTQVYTADVPAGNLSKEYSKKFNLPDSVIVSVGALDAHLGAVGSGVKTGTMVKILGTSACDMLVKPITEKIAVIPGICGTVAGSILPGYYGIEAGQSAVGDIFNWFVHYFKPAELTHSVNENKIHAYLTERAAKLRPGDTGLLALDWNNGNRNVLVDARLTGLLIGQTLHTTAPEIYRTLIESTAFGAEMIINRLTEYGIKVIEIITGGGIAEKNPMLLQIYADVTNRPWKLAESSQTCALGAAIMSSVAAGERAGGFATVESAQNKLCRVKSKTYYPKKENVPVYCHLFKLYQQLHDSFGTKSYQSNLFNIMKDLLTLKSRHGK